MGMGYQGYVLFYQTGAASPTKPDDPLLILTTGASVNLVLEPIYSAAVLGHGWLNAATSSHYADNVIRYEGSIDYELQGSPDLWNFMANWMIYQRAHQKSADISPDGARVYHYWTDGVYDDTDTYLANQGLWNTSASFSTSEGSFVTVSAGAVGLDRTETDPDGGSDFDNFQYINQRTGVIASNCGSDGFGSSNPLNPGGANLDPIPYWKTNANILQLTEPDDYVPFESVGGNTTIIQDGLETVEWSADLTHNHIILYTANGSRNATALLQGPQDVTSSVTLYHPSGPFDPITGPDGTGTVDMPFANAETNIFRIEISNSLSSTGFVYIELPAIVIESDDFSIPGQDAITNRVYSLKGLGGRCTSSVMSVLPPLLMSDSDGGLSFM